MVVMNLLRTAKTYKTYANAEAALSKAMALDVTDAANRVRYLIAANAEGRFAPVLVGTEYLPYAVALGITVVG